MCGSKKNLLQKNIYFYKSYDVILELMVFWHFIKLKTLLPDFLAYFKSLTSIKYAHLQTTVCWWCNVIILICEATNIAPFLLYWWVSLSSVYTLMLASPYDLHFSYVHYYLLITCPLRQWLCASCMQLRNRNVKVNWMHIYGASSLMQCLTSACRVAYMLIGLCSGGGNYVDDSWIKHEL